MSWWSELLEVGHADPHTRRRGRLLALVLLATIVLLAVFIPITLLNPSPGVGFSIITGAIALFIACLILVRRGYVTAGGWLFALAGILVSVISIAGSGSFTSAYYLVIPVIMASLVLRPSQSWWVLAIALIGIVAAAASLPNTFSSIDNLNQLISPALMLVIATLLSSLGGRATEQALDVAETNAARAATAQAHAEEQARDLEAQAETLRRTEQQLHDLVATLETPTVALAEGILLAPLVGTIDSRRARMLTERLLRDISRQRVRLLILDIAGVTLIDTAVAQTLLQITQSVRLLGCRVVLTSISPTVAMTLMHLGIDVSSIETARSPQEVLASLGPPDTGFDDPQTTA